jgi:hypothetical protein
MPLDPSTEPPLSLHAGVPEQEDDDMRVDPTVSCSSCDAVCCRLTVVVCPRIWCRVTSSSGRRRGST